MTDGSQHSKDLDRSVPCKVVPSLVLRRKWTGRLPGSFAFLYVEADADEGEIQSPDVIERMAFTRRRIVLKQTDDQFVS